MRPSDFFAMHGLIVDHPIDDARWHRVATTDHPKKKNGAYLLDGDRAVCQNWATMDKPIVMRDETVRRITPEDRAAAAKRRHEREMEQRQAWERAAARAGRLLQTCRPGNHGYLMRKGFEGTAGLVTTVPVMGYDRERRVDVVSVPEGALFVAMRDAHDTLVGAQTIHWDQLERQWVKKYIAGMRAKGSCHLIGRRDAKETVLCEGYATGLSIREAAQALNLSMNVLVCFSAGNLVDVATAPLRTRYTGRMMVFADHDRAPGEAGQKAAVKTGLPWTMAEEPGFDANDVHQHVSLNALCKRLMQLRKGGIEDWRSADEPEAAA